MKKSISIIGYGYVGKAIYNAFDKNGYECLIYDKNMYLSNSSMEDIVENEFIFVCVSTNQIEESLDIGNVIEVIDNIEKYNKNNIIIIKSTLSLEIIEYLKKYDNIVVNPEFLTEDNYINDFLKPSRIVYGSNNIKLSRKLNKLYNCVIKTKCKRLYCSISEAIIIKLSSNSFLAYKLSFINEIANLSDKYNSNIDNIILGLTSDDRIGKKYMCPGIGYGGNCLPKDTMSLNHELKNNNSNILEETIITNNKQSLILITKLKNKFMTLKGISVALTGISFKKGTNTLRGSIGVKYLDYLLNNGVYVTIYDNNVIEELKDIYNTSIKYASSMKELIKDKDALMILNNNDCLKEISNQEIESLMRNPYIFDGRNNYDIKYFKNSKISYYAVGKKYEK